MCAQLTRAYVHMLLLAVENVVIASDELPFVVGTCRKIFQFKHIPVLMQPPYEIRGNVFGTGNVQQGADE